MAFDECPPGGSEYDYALKSMEMTHRWLDRCITRFNSTGDKYGYTQNLFPIVQGGTFKDLRQQSCEYVASKNAAGNAIGGLSVGEPEQVRHLHGFAGVIIFAPTWRAFIKSHNDISTNGSLDIHYRFGSE